MTEYLLLTASAAAALRADALEPLRRTHAARRMTRTDDWNHLPADTYNGPGHETF